MVRRRAFKQRKAERGTALFVVVLAITMLTGIGLYAVHSSSLLARAAGNEREALETAYIAQLGTLATLSELATAPGAYIPFAINAHDDCRMNAGLDPTKFLPPPCMEKSSNKFALTTGKTMFDADSFGTAIDPATGTYAISGRFLTETTDIAVAGGPVAGMDAVSRNAFRYYEAKLTTIAQLQPAAANAACVQNVMQVAGQHITRAQVLLGPVGGI